MGQYQIRITVKEIKGECHIHNVDDTYLVEEDGQSLRLEKGEKICTYALSGMLPLFSALSKELGKEDWMAAETQIYQCPDPGQERGGGGTVYFEVKRKRIS
ncbi:MAG: TIGR04076 family protein [Thermodesulfobacteriota bacterium]|nr:TIGR04076 family protein [Thermodesulfobacteriota bacterium]